MPYDVAASRAVLLPRGALRPTDRAGPLSADHRGGRALSVIADLGILMLFAWLLPFIILAIGSPIALVLAAMLALVHLVS
jgi:hypothetical protein